MQANRFKISIVILAAVLIVVGFTASHLRNSSPVSSNLAVPYPWEAVLQLAPDGSKIYQEWQYEAVPNVRRLPTKFTTNRVDLFSYPKVVQQMTYALPGTKYLCNGPEGNIYVWKNDQAIQSDLLSADGYTVFNLDCRDELANSLVAFITVIDMNGDIVGVHMPHTRAESVSMYDTKTVLFSCTGGEGAFLWNCKKTVFRNFLSLLMPIRSSTDTQITNSMGYFWMTGRVPQPLLWLLTGTLVTIHGHTSPLQSFLESTW